MDVVKTRRNDVRARGYCCDAWNKLHGICSKLVSTINTLFLSAVTQQLFTPETVSLGTISWVYCQNHRIWKRRTQVWISLRNVFCDLESTAHLLWAPLQVPVSLGHTLKTVWNTKISYYRMSGMIPTLWPLLGRRDQARDSLSAGWGRFPQCPQSSAMQI